MQVNLQKFDSVGDLEKHINFYRQKNTTTMLLGKDSIVKNGAYVFSTKINDIYYEIGLITQNALKPECVVIENFVFVGFNDEVDIINNEEVVGTYRTLAPFYEFIQYKDYVLAIFEIDVICFDKTGVIFWEYVADDIIIDFFVRENYIVIKFDEDIITIDISTGEKLQ